MLLVWIRIYPLFAYISFMHFTPIHFFYNRIILVPIYTHSLFTYFSFIHIFSTDPPFL